MSFAYECDFCGERIELDDYLVTLTVAHQGEPHLTLSQRDEVKQRSGWISHYHRGCWKDLHSTLRKLEKSARSAPTSREMEQAWRQMPRDQRERLVLEGLANSELTLRQLTARISSMRPDLKVYQTDITTLARKMVDTGELQRRPEPWNGKVRYRYFRLGKLEGPIADLNRILTEGES